METISARELDWYARDGRIPIIDLRSRDEFAHDHVSGAINVPQGNFHGELKRQGADVILYCERGALSMAVARRLEEQGYRTKTVVGGFRAYKRMEIW